MRLAMVVATAVIAVGIWLSLVVGAQLVDMEIGALRLTEATFSTVWLGLAFGTFALALGSTPGKRSISIWVTAALATAAYLLNAMAPLAESLEPSRKFSSSYYNNGLLQQRRFAQQRT